MTDVEVAVEQLAHREVDIALIPTTVHHKSLGMAPLGKDELVAVIAPGNPLAGKERVLAADLKEQRLITPPPGNLRFVPWDDFLIHSEVFPKVVVETDDLELAKHLARENVGITVAPRWSGAERGGTRRMRGAANRPGWCIPRMVSRLPQCNPVGGGAAQFPARLRGTAASALRRRRPRQTSSRTAGPAISRGDLQKRCLRRFHRCARGNGRAKKHSSPVKVRAADIRPFLRI